jgi:hypothetical protein
MKQAIELGINLPVASFSFGNRLSASVFCGEWTTLATRFWKPTQYSANLWNFRPHPMLSLKRSFIRCCAWRSGSKLALGLPLGLWSICYESISHLWGDRTRKTLGMSIFPAIVLAHAFHRASASVRFVFWNRFRLEEEFDSTQAQLLTSGKSMIRSRWHKSCLYACRLCTKEERRRQSSIMPLKVLRRVRKPRFCKRWVGLRPIDCLYSERTSQAGNF